MRRTAALVAVLPMLMPTVAWCDWKYAHWGATPEQLAQASGGAVKVLPAAMRVKHSAPWNSTTAAKGSYVDGELRLNLSFSFDLKSGGLNCIIFESAGKSSDALMKRMFLGANGTPLTNANHKELGMETFSWSTRTDDIGLTLMGEGGGSFATQCVPGTNPPVE
jgi:hypothetical protein